MGDLKCPKCGQKHLRVHSIIVPEDVHYEWECGWCGYHEGDYLSRTAAVEDYEKRYGGNK